MLFLHRRFWVSEEKIKNRRLLHLTPWALTIGQATVAKAASAINHSSDQEIDSASPDLELPTATVELEKSTVPVPYVTPAAEIITAPATATPHASPAKAEKLADPDTAKVSTLKPADSWCGVVKGPTSSMKKKGTAFTLPSREACVKIPNAVIERNTKSWECFVLGQFYSDPPSQGTIHNTVNGIWSKQFRDIVVSKMEGHAFLFRIPNSFTRARVINQRLWQIVGQTMFVAKWEPGVIPVKPELKFALIWLELRNVPLQFFNEETLERIAGLVDDPKCLHPSTANKTNLEVAKVFTVIDPRKPLPEAVNVQFESGEIKRILVSSPWMPRACAHSKEIGHVIKRCKLAPVKCATCRSSAHDADHCTRSNPSTDKPKKNRRKRSKSPVETIWKVKAPRVEPITPRISWIRAQQ